MSQKRKALLLFHSSWNDNNRGFVAALDQYSMNHSVIIACSGNITGLQTRGVKSFDFTHGIKNRLFINIIYRNVTTVPFWQLLYLMLRYSPNVLYTREICFLPSVALVKLFFPRLHLVVDIRENPDTYFPRQAHFLKRFRRLIGEVRTNSPELKDRLESKFLLKGVAVTYAFPTKRFLSSICSPTKRIKNEKIRLCFFGNVTPDRNIHIVIQAINKVVEDVVFDVYGNILSNEYKEYLNDIDSKNRVNFFGNIEYASAPKILVSYDCGILMNESNENSVLTIPGKLWEYTSCGLCLVSNSRPTVKGFIEKNRLGLIADSVEEIAEAIHELSNNKSLLEELKENSRIFFVNAYSQQNDPTEDKTAKYLSQA